MSQAPAFGIATSLTEDSLQPVELARWLEERDFESLFVGEHTHLPTAPHRYGDGVSDDYKKFYDPRKYLRLGEQGMVDRLLEACEDLGSRGRSIAG